MLKKEVPFEVKFYLIPSMAFAFFQIVIMRVYLSVSTIVLDGICTSRILFFSRDIYFKMLKRANDRRDRFKFSRELRKTFCRLCLYFRRTRQLSYTKKEGKNQRISRLIRSSAEQKYS